MDVLEKWVHRFAKYCGDDEKLKKGIEIASDREHRPWITHIYTVISAFAKKKKKVRSETEGFGIHIMC